MLAAGMIGLREILESPKDTRSVIEQQSNENMFCKDPRHYIF